MAATDHTRLRSAQVLAPKKSTDKSRDAARGRASPRRQGRRNGVPPEAADARLAAANSSYQSLAGAKDRSRHDRREPETDRDPRLVPVLDTPFASEKQLAPETIPGGDLRQILHEFDSALAIVETTKNALRGNIAGLTCVRSETLALTHGVKELSTVRNRLYNLIEGKAP